MSSKKSVKLTKRKKYTVKSLVNDLKKIGCTPRVLDTVGREVVYFEWSQAQELLGEDHPVTTNLGSLLGFMRGGCEKRLIDGDLWRAADTSHAAINEAIKGAPKEFLSYQFLRSPEHIRFVLDSVLEERSREMKEYKKMEKGIRRQLKSDPDNPDLWNQLRLLLWILGRYKESSEAFKKAKKLGWDKSTSHFVAI
ncbi:MAG: tetratricopeptide repeat protein [Candidatus Thorarchaeota archaeon]|jgi:tetratricopeptide (TPR) repeat protein